MDKEVDDRAVASVWGVLSAAELSLKKHHGRAEALLIAAYGEGQQREAGCFSPS